MIVGVAIFAYQAEAMAFRLEIGFERLRFLPSANALATLWSRPRTSSFFTS